LYHATHILEHARRAWSGVGLLVVIPGLTRDPGVSALIINTNHSCILSLVKFGHDYYVYILASQRNGTLYIGVTNNLTRRVLEHKHGGIEGFTQEYNVHQLVYWEHFFEIGNAIAREKQLKNWKRIWKMELIEKSNPQWKDLLGPGSSPG
jgi:putative endonuclease